MDKNRKQQILDYLKKYQQLSNEHREQNITLIKSIIVDFPFSYFSILRSRKFQNLWNEIVLCTSFLDEVYSKNDITRVFYYINNIDNAIRCHTCNNIYDHKIIPTIDPHTLFHCSNTCAQNDSEIQERIQSTKVLNKTTTKDLLNRTKQRNKEKYGVDWYVQTDDFKQKQKNTFNCNGYSHPMRSDIIKKQMADRYNAQHGVDSPFKNPAVQAQIKKKYTYNNINFDSAVEIAYYIWLTDNKKEFQYKPDKVFYYECNGKQHFYMPDFKVEDQYIELKGDHFFDINGNMQNPYDHSQDELYRAKQRCMASNNVKILKFDQYKKYLKYVHTKYGKKYLHQFKKTAKAQCQQEMPIFDDQLNAEIQDIVDKNPKNYCSVIQSKGIKNKDLDRTYLLEYINKCTPLLQDSFYTLKTKIYWVLNKLTDFPVCMSKQNGIHKMEKVNVKKLKDGYPKFCSSKCQHQAKEYYQLIKDSLKQKYGVINPGQLEHVKELHRVNKDSIAKKRDQTLKQHFGEDVVGWNLKKSIETRRAKYGCVWNIDKVKEAKLCLQKTAESNIVDKDKIDILLNSDLLDKEFNLHKKLCSMELQDNCLSKRWYSNNIVKYFQQDVFYAKEKQLWKNPETKQKIIENRQYYLRKNANELTSLDILDGFKRSGMWYGYSHFNPQIFSWFIKKYNVKVCYDPCGGWGHRLLGALNIDKYIYNDLSTSTKENVDRMVKYFNISNVETYCKDARDFIPQDDFDSMFTCPPYFNVEHYPCGDFKDVNEFNQFLDKLFKVFYDKSSCKVFGIVIREDLMVLDNYSQKFLVSRVLDKYLSKVSNKQDEYLYVFRKD